MIHTYPSVLVVSDRPVWASTIAKELLGDNVIPPTLGTDMGCIEVRNKYFKSTVGLHIGCTSEPVSRATMDCAHGVVLIVAPPRAGYRQYFNEMLTRMSSYICQRTINRGSIHDVEVEMRLCVVVMANDYPEKDTIIREWQTMCLDNQFELIERNEDEVTFQGLSKIPTGSLAQRADAEYTASSRILECIHETNWSKVACRNPPTPLLPVYLIYAESEDDMSILSSVADRFQSRLGLLIGEVEPHNKQGLYIPCMGSFTAIIPPSQKDRMFINCPSRFAIVVCRGPKDSSLSHDESVIGTSMWRWSSHPNQLTSDGPTHTNTVDILCSTDVQEATYADAIWSLSHNRSAVVLEDCSLEGVPLVDCGDQWDEEDGYLGWARVAELIEIDVEMWLADHYSFESADSKNSAMFIYGLQSGIVPNLFAHHSISVCPSSVPRHINVSTQYYDLSGVDAVWVFELSEIQFVRHAIRRCLKSKLQTIHRWYFTDDVVDEPQVSDYRLPYKIICSALSTPDWLRRHVLPFTQSLEPEESPNVVILSAVECDASDFRPTRESDMYTMPFVSCVDLCDDDLVGVVQDAMLSAPWRRSVVPVVPIPSPPPLPQLTLPALSVLGCELPPYLFVDPVSMQTCCYPLNPFVHKLGQLSDLLWKLSNRGIVAASDEVLTLTTIRHMSIDFELKRSQKFALEFYIDGMTLSELMKSVKLNGSMLPDAERQRQAGLLAEAMGELVMM